MSKDTERDELKLPTVAVTYPALAEANKALSEMAERMRGLRVLGAEEIQAIQAAAWDEGHDAAGDEAAKYENPYRRPSA